ncbi:cation-transporting ATPase [Entomoplasma freundtii]|uniref:Cation-transporting ATPase n=1 Tax=Entomoplasma freundtii TaxID=74700 RepID=A0A2K8NQI8_9MOLU|nr:cation-translocating P-type ATPase [Entomoplasma freundtii]ATZ16089.1 cation-transporting ATPase [Entomoplasma freundtii]
MDKKPEVKTEKRWYAMSNEEICEKLKVNPAVGLTDQEAKTRLKEDGENKLNEPKETNAFVIFLKTLIDPLAIIMLLAGFLSIILPLALGRKITPAEIPGIVVIFGVVITNSVIATFQELKARSSLKALQSLTESKVVVLRDGKQKEINTEDLVRGDIVYLETGKFVPADIRIIEAPQLKVDESALTGESLPVEKTSDIVTVKDPVLGDQINIGFMSTYVTNGRAIGVVIATGPYSAVGKIAESIKNTKSRQSPLQKKLLQLTFWISIIAFVMGTAVFMISYFASDSHLDKTDKLIASLIFSISAGIALIPESLMIIVTISLSVSAKKLATRNVIVKGFEAIETLGAVDVICSDKTGTLTQNRMTIEKIFVNNETYDVNDFKYNAKDLESWSLVNGMILCSDAISEGNNRIGDPTEIAITDWGHRYKINEVKLREDYKRVDEIPFDSERKLMTTVNIVNKKRMVYCKGALDQLLEICTHVNLNGKVIPLTKEMKESIFEKMVPLLESALRVLGLAVKELPANAKDTEKDLETNLIFIGAIAMMDPPRREARLAVSRAHESGIRVIMITGDHKITALAIGKRLGIVDDTYNEALSGSEMKALTDQELINKLKHVNVFARVNPEDKTRIVEILEGQKDIVAMTGDGVNDAPSLTKADIGIAMGMTGTDVAKEAANVILTDDNFATIISGVREGRNVYEKIKTSIAFLLGANFAQMFTILFILAFAAIVKTEGETVALGTINVLWHILVVETLLAVPISLAHSRETVMSYQPRSKRESVFKWIIIEIISITLFNTLFAIAAFLITYYTYAKDVSSWGVGENNWLVNGRVATSSMAAYVVIIFAPIFYVPLVGQRNYTVYVPKEKREKIRINEWMVGAMVLAFVLNILTLFVPGLNTIFNVPTPEHLPTGKMTIIVFYSIGLSILVAVCKWGETWIFHWIYQKNHKQDIRIATFDFAKKQKRDKIKQLYRETRAKAKKIRQE